MIWISSALLSDLSDEIFFRIDSIISVNLMISEFGGLYTLPIILNFFEETLTFKKMDSKTLSSKTDIFLTPQNHVHFLPNRVPLPPTFEHKLSI